METAGSGATHQTVDEVKQLKACIDGLIGFVTLPATWSVCGPSDIVAPCGVDPSTAPGQWRSATR